MVVGKLVYFGIYLIIKIIQKFRVYFYQCLSTNLNRKISRCFIYQPVQYVGKGNIELDEVTIGVFPSPYFLNTYTYLEARHQDSSICIGRNTIINNGSMMIADRGKIYIGMNCLIGLQFSVMNSDFHGLSIKSRMTSEYLCQDVHIGNNVFIGNNVTILKGVTIGDGAVIANGSIVTRNVPENTIFAGVPAKYVNDIPN